MKKFITMLIYFACAALLIFAFAILMPTYDKMKKSQTELIETEKNLSEKKKQTQKLRDEYIGLYSKSDVVEKTAREKYNFCKEDEIVYKYDPKQLLEATEQFRQLK